MGIDILQWFFKELKTKKIDLPIYKSKQLLKVFFSQVHIIKPKKPINGMLMSGMVMLQNLFVEVEIIQIKFAFYTNDYTK